MNGDAVRDLFERAVEMPAKERGNYLAEACGEDAELLAEVQALLEADAAAATETAWMHSAIRNEAVAGADARSAIGETIGRYRVVELIGRGGMGAVYKAERVDAEYEKCVAVKLIDGLFHSAEAIAHFRAERQILANLEHPNIARLLDGGARADGLPYLIMEYVDGSSPYDYARAHELSIAARLGMFREICAAVHFAHQHMVIHRDLKPANILVTAEGMPKLLDFGIAKVFNLDPLHTDDALTEPGMRKLTAKYASPEQVRGEAVTTASDVYSLGVILYELLAGHSPYGDADRPTHQLMAAVCDEEPLRPSVWSAKLKGDLDNILLRALRKDPLQRYGSAAQFSEDLLRYLEGRPVQARGDAPLYTAAKFIRRNRVAVGAAGLLLCSLVAGLIEVTLARGRADRRFNQVRQLAHSVMFDYADAIDRLPGSTPVRERLVKDALTYLDSLAREADSPQLEREIVDAYVRVSNVQGNEYENNLGDTAAALASAQKAVAVAEKMLKKDRSLPALDSAASAFSTDGSLHYSAGDLAAADTAYQRAVSLREEIAGRSPKDIGNRIALATCLEHLGDLYGGNGFQNLGKTAESLAYYGRAKDVSSKLVTEFPGNVAVAKESYETLLSVSGSEAATGKQTEAIADIGSALIQIESVMKAEPQDTNVKVELANAESRIGQMMIDGRDFADALPHLTRSASLLRALTAADTGNAVFRRGEFVVENQWAAALRGSGETAEGVAHNRTALGMAQTLNASAPQSAQYRADVGTGERKLAEGLLAAGTAGEALHMAEQAALVFCTGDMNSPSTAANCDRAELAVGDADLALHIPGAAVTALRKAEGIASALSARDPLSAIFRSDAARSQAALAAALSAAGDTGGARQMYGKALGSWAGLRRTGAITAEDAHRAAAATFALKELGGA